MAWFAEEVPVEFQCLERLAICAAKGFSAHTNGSGVSEADILTLKSMQNLSVRLHRHATASELDKLVPMLLPTLIKTIAEHQSPTATVCFAMPLAIVVPQKFKAALSVLDAFFGRWGTLSCDRHARSALADSTSKIVEIISCAALLSLATIEKHHSHWRSERICGDETMPSKSISGAALKVERSVRNAAVGLPITLSIALDHERPAVAAALGLLRRIIVTIGPNLVYKTGGERGSKHSGSVAGTAFRSAASAALVGMDSQSSVIGTAAANFLGTLCAIAPELTVRVAWSGHTSTVVDKCEGAKAFPGADQREGAPPSLVGHGGDQAVSKEVDVPSFGLFELVAEASSTLRQLWPASKRGHEAVMSCCFPARSALHSSTSAGPSTYVSLLRPFYFSDSSGPLNHSQPNRFGDAGIRYNVRHTVCLSSHHALALFGTERFRMICEALHAGLDTRARTEQPPGANTPAPALAVLLLLDQVVSIAPAVASCGNFDVAATRTKPSAANTMVAMEAGGLPPMAMVSMLPSLRVAAVGLALSLVRSSRSFDSPYLRCHAHQLIGVLERLVEPSLPPPLAPSENLRDDGLRGTGRQFERYGIFQNLNGVDYISAGHRDPQRENEHKHREKERWQRHCLNEVQAAVLDLEEVFPFAPFPKSSSASQGYQSLFEAACAAVMQLSDTFGASAAATLAMGSRVFVGPSSPSLSGIHYSSSDRKGFLGRLLHVVAYALMLEVEPNSLSYFKTAALIGSEDRSLNSSSKKRKWQDNQINAEQSGRLSKCMSSVAAAATAAASAAVALDALIAHAGPLLPPRARVLLDAVLALGLSQLSSSGGATGISEGLSFGGEAKIMGPALGDCGDVSAAFSTSLLSLATTSVLIPHDDGSGGALLLLLGEAAAAVSLANRERNPGDARWGPAHVFRDSTCSIVTPCVQNAITWAARVANNTVEALMHSRCPSLVQPRLQTGLAGSRSYCTEHFKGAHEPGSTSPTTTGTSKSVIASVDGEVKQSGVPGSYEGASSETMIPESMQAYPALSMDAPGKSCIFPDVIDSSPDEADIDAR